MVRPIGTVTVSLIASHNPPEAEPVATKKTKLRSIDLLSFFYSLFFIKTKNLSTQFKSPSTHDLIFHTMR
jgi:hypothetical protein